MTNRALSVAVLALMTALAAPAKAADLLPPPAPVPHVPIETVASGWYLRGDLGLLAFEEPSLQAVGVVAPHPFSGGRLDESWSLGIGLGYKVNGFFRADVTADHRFAGQLRSYSSPVDVALGYATDRGELSSNLLLANVYLDLGTWGGVTPYVGAGVGLADTEYARAETWFTFWDARGAQLSTYFPARSHTGFAYALMAGAAIDLARGAQLDLGYRFSRVDGAATGLDGVLGRSIDDVTAHEARLGLRWMFTGFSEPRAPAGYSTSLPKF